MDTELIAANLLGRNRVVRRRRGGSLIGGLIMIAMGGLFLWFMLPLYEDGKASEAWPEAVGYIEHSEVDSHLSTGKNRKRMYSADVRYRYTVGEQTYQGIDVTLSDSSSSRARSARSTVRDYPVGSQVAVYYDPSLPELAVLEPGVSWFVYGFLLMGSLLVLLGIYVFLRGIVVAIGLLLGIGAIVARFGRS